MLILCLRAARFHERHICHVFGSQRVMIINVVEVAHVLADLSDFGFLGVQSSTKCGIRCLGRR